MSNSGTSFADRFKRNSSFTSQALQNKSEQAQKESIQFKIKQNSGVSQSGSTAKKQVDPKKKMQAELIYLVKGIDAGRNAWYYVLVERLKVQMFLKALNDDIIHLENYGVILYSAYGDEPPAAVTDKLKEEYGIEE